jgi:hypothetical protein
VNLTEVERFNYVYLNLLETEVKVMLRTTTILVSSPHLGPKTRFVLLSHSCEFLDVGRPLWREDGSVVFNCCWASSEQSFWAISSAGLMSISHCLSSSHPQSTGPCPRSHIPPEEYGPVILPSIGFPLRHVLRLAGPRWRYSYPPPRVGISSK